MMVVIDKQSLRREAALQILPGGRNLPGRSLRPVLADAVPSY
jgi:hypothetical protein